MPGSERQLIQFVGSKVLRKIQNLVRNTSQLPPSIQLNPTLL